MKLDKEKIEKQINELSGICEDGKQGIRELISSITGLDLNKEQLDFSKFKIEKHLNGITLIYDYWNIITIFKDGTYLRCCGIKAVGFKLDSVGKVIESTDE